MADNAPANPEPEKEGLRCRSTRSPATGGLLSPPWSSKVSEKKEFVFVKKTEGVGVRGTKQVACDNITVEYRATRLSTPAGYCA